MNNQTDKRTFRRYKLLKVARILYNEFIKDIGFIYHISSEKIEVFVEKSNLDLVENEVIFTLHLPFKLNEETIKIKSSFIDSSKESFGNFKKCHFSIDLQDNKDKAVLKKLLDLYHCLNLKSPAEESKENKNYIPLKEFQSFIHGFKVEIGLIYDMSETGLKFFIDNNYTARIDNIFEVVIPLPSFLDGEEIHLNVHKAWITEDPYCSYIEMGCSIENIDEKYQEHYSNLVKIFSLLEFPE